MQSTSELQREIPNSIHRRRIGYFSVGPVGAGSRKEIERYVQANLAQWGQSYGPGQPYIEYNASLDRYELEWHRAKTVQEQMQEVQRERDWLTKQQYEKQYNMAAHQIAYASQLAQAQAATFAQLYGSGLQASRGSVEPSARVPVPVPRRQVDPPSLRTRLKVFFIALLTGASPFRVYWEIRHNALRVPHK